MSTSLNRALVPLLAAVLLGIVQMYLVVLLWGYISAYTPLPTWLLTQGFRGAPLHAIVHLSDSLLNVVFCLPVAYAICRLKPSRLLIYLLLAIVPGFIWEYRPLLTATPLLVSWTAYVPGVLQALLSLPIATLLVRHALSSRAPNKRLERP